MIIIFRIDVIQNDPYISTKIENEVIISKPNQEWDELDKKKVQLNVRGVYYLQYVIDNSL